MIIYFNITILCFQIVKVCVAYLKHHKINLAGAEVCKVAWDHRPVSYHPTAELRMFPFLKNWWMERKNIRPKEYLWLSKPEILITLWPFTEKVCWTLGWSVDFLFLFFWILRIKPQSYSVLNCLKRIHI